MRRSESYLAALIETLISTEEDQQSDFERFKLWLKTNRPSFSWDKPFQNKIIELLVDEDVKKLFIAIPPRHGKSELCTISYVAYFLINNPNKRVIIASYSQTLSDKFSRKVRAIVKKFVKISQERSAVNDWETVHGGGLRSVGVGGGITGMGADLVIIDDPVKGRQEADSEASRNRTYNWYKDDIFSRLEPTGRLILIMTRWHHDDLAGRIVDETWTTLSLPALAYENDPLGRAVGEPLWPERFSKEKIEEIRETLGSSFSPLYQQQPTEAKENLFDTSKINVLLEKPPCIKMVRFYDLAITARSSSSWSVGLLMGVTEDEEFVVLDVWRARLEAPNLYETIIRNARIDGQNVPVRLEAERTGMIIFQQLLQDNRMRGFMVDTKYPKYDKYTRAIPVASKMASGKISIVQAEWNTAFIRELDEFPNGAYSDQVDALSGAYNFLTERTATISFHPNLFFEGTH